MSATDHRQLTTLRDREIFKRELEDFLPQRLFDSHVHIFEAASLLPGCELAARSCYRRFGGEFTLRQFLTWSDEWLPGRELYCNSFGHPNPDIDRELATCYTGSISDNQRYFGMVLLSPHDPVALVEQRLRDHRLIGYKPYLRYVDWKTVADITIDDMLPQAHMELADKLGLIITLHIPRNERLADPLNQQQMVTLCRNYPNVQIIFAHIGRAYYLENVLGQLDALAACPNAWLDTAMVNHEGVLEYALRHFPRERILFGSDAPIALIRGKSVEINNQYAYLLGEDYDIGTSIYDATGAVDFTTFFYEQLRGIKLAAQRAGLTPHEVENLFYNNAHQLFTATAKRLYAV